MEDLHPAVIIPVIRLACTMAFHLVIRPRLHPLIDTTGPAALAERLIVIDILSLLVLTTVETHGPLWVLPLHILFGYYAGRMTKGLKDAVADFRQTQNNKEARPQ